LVAFIMLNPRSTVALEIGNVNVLIANSLNALNFYSPVAVDNPFNVLHIRIEDVSLIDMPGNTSLNVIAPNCRHCISKTYLSTLLSIK